MVSVERDVGKDRAWSDFVVGAPIDQSGRLGNVLARHLLTRAAVYAIGPEAGAPIKIGYSRRPATRLSDLMISSPQVLKFHLVCWLVSAKEAVEIEQRCHRKLHASGKHIRGEWFNIGPVEAAKVIDSASIDTDCRIVPHRELVRRFQSSRDPLAGLFWGQ